MNTEVSKAATNAAAAALVAEELATTKAQAAMTGLIHRIDGQSRPYRILPNGTIENMEGYLDAPIRRRGEIALHDSNSFVNYVNRFKDVNSVIFADRDESRFTAVLDYHTGGESGAARWGRHRAVLTLRTTTAWDTWYGANGKAMNQADFARFIEDNTPDIAEPVAGGPGGLLEIARTLEAKKSVEFQSHIREDNGSHQFVFNETVQGTASRGAFSIPDRFVLGLQPYEGSDKYRVEARFRYRLQGSTLVLWFDLYRVEDILDEAFADERSDIAAGVGDTVLLVNGPAPAKPGSAD